MSWFSRLCLNSQARFPSKSLFEIYAVDATLKLDSRRAVARGKEKEPQMRPLRVRVDGKHLAVAGEPFRVRGVTYGSFGTRADGAPYPEPERLEADFRAMADAGLNLVCIYTTPPPDVFEAADAAGLRLLVGVHYEDWRCEHSRRRWMLVPGKLSYSGSPLATRSRPMLFACTASRGSRASSPISSSTSTGLTPQCSRPIRTIHPPSTSRLMERISRRSTFSWSHRRSYAATWRGSRS